MHVLRRLRSLVLWVGVLVTFGLGLSAPSASAASGTVTFAEAPGASPNYIFPFAGCAYDSANNINQFQQLMYRPIYWFGIGGSAAYVPTLSMATSPVFTKSNHTVTISLKGWKFADGQVVNAQSVMFFLNLYKADPTAYCGYSPGYGIPDQVQSAGGSGLTVRINFLNAMNPTWLLYDYLSQITPMPSTWDRTATGQAAGCSTGAYGAAATIAACKSVQAYLDAQSQMATTYAGALWQSGVDGPWRLSNFDTKGDATFVANARYSGPQKAQVQVVREVAYATTAAEEADLQAGKISVGYVDPGVLGSNAVSPTVAGANWAPLAGRYDITVGPSWSFNYAAFNFTSADPKSAAIGQLYIRQALQEAVDQSSIVTNVLKGYGVASYSPLPPSTPTTLAAPFANPYPFNLSNARTLLSSHGWTIQNGVQTCTNPGTSASQCGPGITQGYTLTFNLVWAGGTPSLDQTMNAEIASWASLGIVVNHVTASFNTVVGDCSTGSGFELCAWGTGYTYSPNLYPSGESLFIPNASANVGMFSDPVMNNYINQTTFGAANLTAYATYAARELPVLYEPQATVIGEVVKSLKSTVGFIPNPLGNFMPEYFHY